MVDKRDAANNLPNLKLITDFNHICKKIFIVTPTLVFDKYLGTVAEPN